MISDEHKVVVFREVTGEEVILFEYNTKEKMRCLVSFGKDQFCSSFEGKSTSISEVF